MTSSKKKLINGYIMTIIGFVIILFNALCYIFNWDYKSSPLVIIGIVFIGIGTNIIKKYRDNK